MNPRNKQSIRQESLEGNRWYRWGKTPSGTGPEAELPLKGYEGNPNRLRESVAVMAGLGAVGGVTFSTLARAGVGALIGADPDEYAFDSCLTQPCRPGDEGKSKALVQGERAHEANPYVSIATYHGFAQDLPLQLLNRADLILVAGDNLELLVWASWIGAGLRKRVIQGATFGEQWLAIVRSFDPAGAACSACAISTPEWSMLRSRFGCDPATLRAQGIEPTRTLPNICATAADLQASEGLKSILYSSEETLASEEVAYCLQTHRVWRTALPRNAACRLPHESWSMIGVSESSQEVTLSMLARRLEVPRLSKSDPGLQVRGEQPWISYSICSHCGHLVPVRRFGLPGSTLEPCSCGKTLIATPAGVRSVLPQGDLKACLDVPLHSLGLAPGSAVALSTASQWTYFFTNDPPEWEVHPDPARSGKATPNPRNPESGDRK